ncbi:hypothetical protein UPYG_G00041430 [Umbra pygmaea]|uniref:AH domain-containing protein n=1 Tax=Umbra pygmaea TaxID=75934 RepID=A0ABD0Y5P3_UMBPY
MSEVSVEAEARKVPADQDAQMDSSFQNTADSQIESEEEIRSFDSTGYLSDCEVPCNDKADVRNKSVVQNDGSDTENKDGSQSDDDSDQEDQSNNEIRHNTVIAEHDGASSTSGQTHSHYSAAKSENCNQTPQERDAEKEKEDSCSQTERNMAEEVQRSPAAEISVTSNGGLENNDEVFRDPSHGGAHRPESHVSSGSFASTTEGIIESGPFKGSAGQSVSPVAHVAPSSAAASRLARPPSDSGAELQKGSMQAQPQSGPLVLADDLKNPAMEKIDLVRKWSINTYKCTKQILSEKLGRGSRTVDLELEGQIEVLRDNKRKYEQVVKLAQTLANQLTQVMQTQRQLGDAFADLSLKTPELHEEFGYNADTQKLLSKNGETLLGAINFFIASVNTLVDKTIEDTMINIKQYENARVEYDAYRTDLEEWNLGPRDANTLPRIEYSQQQYQIHRLKYEKMRNDVSIKLKFLEENKVKVLHNQLILFHNAIAAYYAGNQQQLEQTLKQFHIKLKMPGGETPSWLEEH